jgi:hypothetical protein
MARNDLLHVPKMCVADKETPTISDLRTDLSSDLTFFSINIWFKVKKHLIFNLTEVQFVLCIVIVRICWANKKFVLTFCQGVEWGREDNLLWHRRRLFPAPDMRSTIWRNIFVLHHFTLILSLKLSLSELKWAWVHINVKWLKKCRNVNSLVIWSTL